MTPDWIAILPVGTFAGRDGRGPYSNVTPQKVIAASMAKAPACGILLDFNHGSEYHGGDSQAAGWIRELALRDGAIHGRVEWTPAGQEAIRAGAFHFVSPAFEHAADGSVLAVRRVGLVNDPNLDLPAIALHSVSHGTVALSINAMRIPLGETRPMRTLMSAIEREICARTGTSEFDYLQARASRRNGENLAVNGTRYSGGALLSAEVAICVNTGVKPAAFLAMKAARLLSANASTRGVIGRKAVDAMADMMRENGELPNSKNDDAPPHAAFMEEGLQEMQRCLAAYAANDLETASASFCRGMAFFEEAAENEGIIPAWANMKWLVGGSTPNDGGGDALDGADYYRGAPVSGTESARASNPFQSTSGRGSVSQPLTSAMATARLSATELRVCELTGVSVEDFLRTRAARR